MSRVKPRTITAPAQKGTKVFEYIGIGVGLMIVGILLLGGAYYVASSSRSAGGSDSGSTMRVTGKDPACPGDVYTIDLDSSAKDINPGGHCRIIHRIESGEMLWSVDGMNFVRADGWEGTGLPRYAKAGKIRPTGYYSLCPPSTGTVPVNWDCTPQIAGS
jgi:hypothetical protein